MQPSINELWTQYTRSRSTVLRNQLVLHYMPMVKTLAGIFVSRLHASAKFTFDDAKSAGTFGLMSAVEGFEFYRGFQFQTYAKRRIYGAMADELRRLDWVPRSVRAAEKAGELADSPTAIRSMGEADVSHCAHGVRGPKFADPAELAAVDERDTLFELCRCLSRRERAIVLMLYLDGLSMKEAAAVLCVSESRVSQIHSRVIQLLRLELKRVGTQTYTGVEL